MPNVWVTSDPHLGHEIGATKHRSFSSVREHDELIIANLKRFVKSDDVLWILGDCGFGDWRVSIQQFREVPGTKHVILGNHDRPHPMHPNSQNYIEEFKKLGGFASVQTAAKFRHGGKRVVMTHYPYEGDTAGRDEDRDLQWRLPDRGVPIIHGHTHSTERASVTSMGTLQLHVGLDAWDFEPVPLRELISASL